MILWATILYLVVKLLFGGDFRQLLPVKPKGTRSELVDLSINRYIQRQSFAKFSLRQNMRALPEETSFSKFLLKVEDGELNDAHDELHLSHFPDSCTADSDSDRFEDLYGDFFRTKN